MYSGRNTAWIPIVIMGLEHTQWYSPGVNFSAANPLFRVQIGIITTEADIMRTEIVLSPGLPRPGTAPAALETTLSGQ